MSNTEANISDWAAEKAHEGQVKLAALVNILEIQRDEARAEVERLRKANSDVLRAHAERLAEALANVQYGGDDECIACGRTQCCSSTCHIATALTLYRAENPKV